MRPAFDPDTREPSLSVDASQLEMLTPYWRLDGRTQSPPGVLSLARRLGRAVRPVLGILRRAAPAASMTVVGAQLCLGLTAAWVLLLANDVLARLLGGGDPSLRLREALPVLLVLAAAYLFQLAMEAVTRRAKAHLVPKVQRAAEEDLYRASLGIDLASFDDPGFYDQLHRARDRGVMHLEGATNCLVELLGATCTVVGAAVALFWLHAALPPVLFLALLPDGWAALRAAGIQYGAMPTTITLTRQVQMMAELATQRESAPEVRANQAQDYVLAEYRRAAIELQDHMVRVGLAEARAVTVGRLLSGLGTIATFLVLGAMLHANWLDLAIAGTVVIALRNTGAAFSRLMQMGHELVEKGLYIDDYRQFLETAHRRVPKATATQAPARPGRIVLDQVSFHYSGAAARQALRNVSLTIERGQTIALVGENGSGKTTLAKLIAGLYPPDQGCITWDGIDLREMDPASRADRIVMVQQHPIRWPRTAADNVRLGRHARPDPDDAALLEAARQARAQEVVDSLPQGWDTLLSREFRGGQDLSSGQWQRLAVARGLYRDAPLVIWDEPTAPLDAKAEYAVYESLRNLAHDRTVILITHRLASIRNADRIFFLQNGALVEQGTHGDLMALDGQYAELHRLQMRLHDPAPA